MSGAFSKNIAFFGRALRKAGLPVGPASVMEAVEAVRLIGISHRGDLKAALSSVFVTKREHIAVFEQAFSIFWRRRALMEKLLAELSPKAPPSPNASKPETLRRVAEALSQKQKEPEEQKPREEKRLDASLTSSDMEAFKQRDFEGMSAAEISEAKRLIARLVLPLNRVKTRRYAPATSGRIDLRAMLRSSLRAGGAPELRHRARQESAPPIVALCDISDSMSQYSRVFLHFLHALAKSGRRVHTFTFATELTNISRALQAHKDPDLALQACGKLVADWDGGTRIGTSLAKFNKQWGRRLLGQNPLVLLITDGLERHVEDELAREMERLHRSCRRLIWLNPLLRHTGFEARARGIKAMLPHVDELRSLHNMHSMEALCRALSADQSEEAMLAANPKRFKIG